MKYLIYIPLLVVFLFGCSEKSTEPKSSSGVVVSFSADSVQIEVGEETYIRLKLNLSNLSIFGISMRMDYNPDIVSFDDLTDFVVGDYFGTEIVSFVKSEENSIHLSISLTQGEDKVGGSGDLGILMFTGLSQGVSDIEIVPSELNFFDSDGSNITIPSLVIDNAVISVQ